MASVAPNIFFFLIICLYCSLYVGTQLISILKSKILLVLTDYLWYILQNMNLPFMLIFHICLFIFLNCVSEDKQYRVSLPHSFKFSQWGKKKELGSWCFWQFYSNTSSTQIVILISISVLSWKIKFTKQLIISYKWQKHHLVFKNG